MILVAATTTTADTIRIERSTLEALYTQLDESNKALEASIRKIEEKDAIIKELRSFLIEANQAIEASNVALELAKDRIQKDQKEIEELRKYLMQSIEGLAKQKFFRAGIGVTFPIGGQILMMGDVPGIPVGLFTSFSLNKSFAEASAIDWNVAFGFSFRF